MSEGNALEANAPAAAPAKRSHAIVLCCAKSVESMVQEIARNLRGMGFVTDVVCGVRARDALIGVERSSSPTVHVVCVQDPLKETVLKPLRSALAERGGSDQHLLVAVLDLALPLAMVTQIRRFIDALPSAGTAASSEDSLAARHRVDVALGPEQQRRLDTHSHRVLRLVQRSPSGVAAAPRPRRIVSARTPARVLTTQKYRAVTGPLPPIERERRERDKTRLYDRRKAKPHTSLLAPDIEVKSIPEPKDAKRAVPASGARRSIHAPATTPDEDDDFGLAPPMPKLEPRPPEQARGSGTRWIVAALVVLAAVALWWLWRTAARDRGPELHATADTDARARPAAGTEGDDRGRPPTPRGTGDVERDQAWAPHGGPSDPDVVDEDGHEPPGEDAALDPRDDDPAEPGEADPDGDDAAPDHEGPTVPGPETADDRPQDETPAQETDSALAQDDAASSAARDATTQASSRDEAALASAADARKIKRSTRLWVARLGDATVDWMAADRACRDHEVDGVGGWRLAHRRELKALGVSRVLGPGVFWSKTELEDDPEFAYVFHGQQLDLITFLKKEPTAKVVCVRVRERPD
jgi:hypothetical protein